MAAIRKLGIAAVCSLLGFVFPAPGEAVRLTEAEVAAEFHQRTWRREHGLPDERVNCLLQTSDGYLWIGTQRGLARYDGREFRVFNSINTPAFTSDDCIRLVEDAQGALWVGTRDGIIRFSGNRFTRSPIDDTFLAVTDRAELCPSRSGGIVASRQLLLCWLNGSEVRGYAPERPESHAAAYVNSICEDGSGSVWLATWGGLIRYDRGENRFDTTPLGETFADMPATALRVTDDGTMWVVFSDPAPPPEYVGSRRWLAAFRDGQVLRKPNFEEADLASSRGEFIVPDSRGHIWLGGGRNGLHRFTGSRFEFLPVKTGLAEDFPLCATVDREGNVWIGTAKSGLQCWTPKKSRWHDTGPTAAEANVWSMLQARDGAVWAGTDEGVLRIGQHGIMERLNEPEPLRNVRSLAQDSTGTIWAGTMRDLHWLEANSWSKLMLPGEWYETKIRAMVSAKQGGLWIGTVRGLNHLALGKVKKYTTADGLPAEEVRAILESTSGVTWIGTLGGGLACLSDGKFATLTSSDGLSNNNVWALYEDPQGDLWIGTENGLNRFRKGQLTVFTREQGLPDNLVNSIIEDDAGRLWIGHDRGIYWIARQDLEDVAAGKRERVRAVVHQEAGGPASLETNGQKSNPAVCKSRDGHLWFPTTTGVLEIDPALAHLDTVAPKTVIETFSANGEVVWHNLPDDGDASPEASRGPMPAIFRLPAGQGRVLEVRFTANTFVLAERVRFRYRLHGLSAVWIDLGTRRQLHLNDLRPGDYQLEIAACNHHGVWQEQGAMMAFQLAPFFYQTWWFYLVVVGAASGAVGLAVRWRLGEIRKIQELERINALNEQRRRIARDVHDDIGASLTHILQLTQATPEPAQPGSPLPAANRIATIAEAAVDNMAEIVWANNPEFDTFEDLGAYLREYAANFLASTSLRWKLRFPECLPKRNISGLVRRHLLLILKEALQNVVKHAQASEVEVRLEAHDSLLVLLVSDNGCGSGQKAARRFGNGLTNMRSRAEEIGGTLELEGEERGGTLVRVRVPLKPGNK